MNIDGITAVIFCELGFEPELGRGLFVLSRSVGILAHAWEQKQQRPPDHGADAEGNSVPLQRAGAPIAGIVDQATTATTSSARGSSRADRETRRSTSMKDTVANQLVKYLEARGVEARLRPVRPHQHRRARGAREEQKIKFVNTRHEQVAAHAADGYARATKKDVGACCRTCRPGLTNAATGVANAALDSIPMVVIAGDVPTHYYGKHPHQEVNLHADASQYEIYRPFVKRAWRVDRPHLFPEIIEKAFTLAESGRPGPVLVDVPMDIFSKEVDVGAVRAAAPNTKSLRKPSLDEETATEIVKRAARGEAPADLRRRRHPARRRRRRAARAGRHLQMPVAHTLMGKGALPDDHPLVLGMTGFWGTKFINEQVPRRRLDPGPRHALLRGRLQLVGARVHVQHPADEADPHRHRSGRDRPQLSRSRSARWRT